MSIADKFDLPQGIPDLLIMRVVALGPIHGYGIAQRIQKMSREALQAQPGSSYPALHCLEYEKLTKATWKASETGREASSTSSPPRAAPTSRPKPRTGAPSPTSS